MASGGPASLCTRCALPGHATLACRTVGATRIHWRIVRVNARPEENASSSICSVCESRSAAPTEVERHAAFACPSVRLLLHVKASPRSAHSGTPARSSVATWGSQRQGRERRRRRRYGSDLAKCQRIRAFSEEWSARVEDEAAAGPLHPLLRRTDSMQATFMVHPALKLQPDSQEHPLETQE